MKKTEILIKIKNELKRKEASAGEICTELLKLKRASKEALTNYLESLSEI